MFLRARTVIFEVVREGTVESSSSNQILHLEVAGVELHRCDGHANAKEHAGKNTLRPAFTEGKRETRHYNGNERETASDGAGDESPVAVRLTAFSHGEVPVWPKGRSRET